MARIRTVKPEFWSSPDTAACGDPWARLLFVAMWNWADDAGRGTANPKELAGFAFPNDDAIDSTRVRRMLAEVSKAFGVILYKVGGRPYYFIPSWEKHQKIDRKSQPKYPAPEEGDPWSPEPPQGPDQGGNGHQPLRPRVVAEDSGSMQRALYEASGTGTGEQGNRGTTTSLTAAAARTSETEAEPKSVVALKPDPRIDGKTDDEWFAEFWAAYPRKADKQDALRAFKALLRKRTVKPDRLVRAALSYGQQNAGKEIKYLKHAATWLNKGSYENEPEQGHLTLVPDAPTLNSFEDYRQHAAGPEAAKLLGIGYVPRSQPPSDHLPQQQWDALVAVEWIDKHEREIRDALLAERRPAG